MQDRLIMAMPISLARRRTRQGEVSPVAMVPALGCHGGLVVSEPR